MTHEGFRPALPVADEATGARIELENLFSRPQPAATVVVKKRRRHVGQGPTSADDDQVVAADAPTLRAEAVDRHPRVYRMTSALAHTADASALAQTNGTESGNSPLTAGSSLPLRTRRTRAARDLVRRPSPVHIVLQAPPKPALPAYVPAWRRILCVEPEEFSYGHVLQALSELQDLVQEAQEAQEAQRANRFRPDPFAG